MRVVTFDPALLLRLPPLDRESLAGERAVIAPETRGRKDAVSGATQARDENGRFAGDGGGGGQDKPLTPERMIAHVDAVNEKYRPLISDAYMTGGMTPEQRADWNVRRNAASEVSNAEWQKVVDKASAVGKTADEYMRDGISSQDYHDLKAAREVYDKLYEEYSAPAVRLEAQRAEERRSVLYAEGKADITVATYESNLPNPPAGQYPRNDYMPGGSMIYQASATSGREVAGPAAIALPGRREAVEFVQRVLGEDSPYRGQVDVRSRELYTRAYYNAGSVTMWDQDEPKTLVHELGHYLEASGGDTIQKMRYDFVERRVGMDTMENTNPVSLKSLSPLSAYRPDEMTRPDRFPDPYVGKVYAKQSEYGDVPENSEVISMGLQYLYVDPKGFAEKDPDYFKFMQGVIGTMRKR